METVIASFESRTISTASWLWKGVLEWSDDVEDLIFDLESDVSSEEEINPDLGPRRCNLRLRFQPHLVGVNAYTGSVDDSIRDTHLQRRLKGDPFAQAWKGMVCCLYFSSSRFLLNACANE